MLYASATMLSLLMFIACARAGELPQGITCDQVVYYASQLGVPDTRWGRARAKVIALTLGFRLTDSQLDAARQCLKEARAR